MESPTQSKRVEPAQVPAQALVQVRVQAQVQAPAQVLKRPNPESIIC